MSAAAHVAAFLLLGAAPTAFELRLASATVDVVVEPPPPPAPEPTPEPEPPEPEPPPRPAPRPQAPPPAHRPAAAEDPAPTDPPPPPEEETPVDFSGVTLTNETGGASWASAVGSGAEAAGPIGPPGRRTTRRVEGDPRGVLGGTPGGRGDVPAEDLSRPPAPDFDLNAALTQQYPEQPHQLGIEGRAVVRLRITPHGTAVALGTALEDPTGYGFGAACARAARNGRWTVALDRNGAPVPTRSQLACEFEIRD